MSIKMLFGYSRRLAVVLCFEFIFFVGFPGMLLAASYQHSFDSGILINYNEQSDGQYVVAVQNPKNIDKKYFDLQEGLIQGSTLKDFPVGIKGSHEADQGRYVIHVLNGSLVVTFQNAKSVLVATEINDISQFQVSTLYYEDSLGEQWLLLSLQYGINGQFKYREATVLLNSEEFLMSLNMGFSHVRKNGVFSFDKHSLFIRESDGDIVKINLLATDSSNSFFKRTYPEDKTEESEVGGQGRRNQNHPVSQKNQLVPVSNTSKNNGVKGSEEEFPSWIRDGRELLSVKNYIEANPEELKRVYKSLLNQLNPSAVLLSDSSLRRLELQVALVKAFLTNAVPRGLQNHEVFLVDAISLTSSTKYRGEFEGKIEKMVALSQQRKIIWVMNHIHTLAGKGTHEGQNDGAFEMLLPHMQSGDITILGLSTDFDYSVSFNKRELKEALPAIFLDDLSKDNIYEAVKGYILERFSYNFDSNDLAEFIAVVDRADTISTVPDKYLTIFSELAAEYEVENRPVSYDLQAVEKIIQKFYHFDSNAQNELYLPAVVQELVTSFDDQLVAQSYAKKAIIDMSIVIGTNTHDSEKPKYFYLLDGPRGLGKTKIVQLLAEVYERNFVHIDMGTYATPKPGDIDLFKIRIYHAVNKDPQTIFLFDEIDKCPVWFQEGVLTVFGESVLVVQMASGTGAGGPQYTVKADLSRASYFFGSNAASQYIEELTQPKGQIGFTHDRHGRKYEASAHLKFLMESKKISVPLLSRITDVIPFFTPVKAEFREVVKLHVSNAIDQIVANSNGALEVIISAEQMGKVLDKIVSENFYVNRDNRVAGIIDKYIRVPLAKAKFQNVGKTSFYLSIGSSDLLEFKASGCQESLSSQRSIN